MKLSSGAARSADGSGPVVWKLSRKLGLKPVSVARGRRRGTSGVPGGIEAHHTIAAERPAATTRMKIASIRAECSAAFRRDAVILSPRDISPNRTC